MNMKTIGKWSYLIGLAVALVTALVGYSEDWLSLVVVILAILAGLFLCKTEELTNYGIRYLVLVAVAAALNSFPYLGEPVTTIAMAMAAFFAPIILTVLLVFNFKQAVDFIKK
jgi:hypothetical protein